MKLNEREFADIIQSALDRIPSEIRRHIVNVAITVQKRPSRALMEDMGIPPDD